MSEGMFDTLKVKRVNLHEEIAENIQKMIAQNSLPPGYRLPSDRELAVQLNVSRPTVRAALQLLEQRGLIEIKVGSGTYIKNFPRSNFAEAFERYFIFRSCSHEDLLTLREINEPEIAALAAVGITNEEINRLRTIIEQIECRPVSEGGVDPELDMAFHEGLAAATRNDLIAALMSGLHKVMHNSLVKQFKDTRSNHRVIENAIRLHRQVFEAVAARNPEAAREAMRLHMKITREAYLDVTMQNTLASKRSHVLDPGEDNENIAENSGDMLNVSHC